MAQELSATFVSDNWSSRRRYRNVIDEANVDGYRHFSDFAMIEIVLSRFVSETGVYLSDDLLCSLKAAGPE